MVYAAGMSEDPERAQEPDDADGAVPADAGGSRPRRPREPLFNLPPVVLALGGICVLVHLVRVYVLTPEQDYALLVRTAFLPIRYTGGYEPDVWAVASPVTYAFLHGGWMHLLLNMIWFATFGSPLANRLGGARMLAFWIVTGIGAVLMHFVVHPFDDVPVIGASGSISGMMGAAARYGFRIDRSQGRGIFAGALLPVGTALRSRGVLSFLVVWFVINLVTGLVGLMPDQDAPIAWEAHVGGFLAGFLGIGLFDRPPPDDEV